MEIIQLFPRGLAAEDSEATLGHQREQYAPAIYMNYPILQDPLSLKSLA